MNHFFSKYKKIIVGVLLFWGILLLLFFVNLGHSFVRVNNYSDNIIANNDSTASIANNWNNKDFSNLEKEHLWLEQQLNLSKSDSFSLGINLKDSLVQVQLKGTVLFQTKILHQKPTRFYTNTNKETYFNIFGEVARIDSSIANVPKRVLIKVQAPPVGTEREIQKTDSVKVEQINWTFTSSNHLQIVIYGIQQNPDSTFTVPEGKDIFNYRLKHELKNPFTSEYTPTLFLWLNDNDAKAIYRALPEKARFIFRN